MITTPKGIRVLHPLTNLFISDIYILAGLDQQPRQQYYSTTLLPGEKALVEKMKKSHKGRAPRWELYKIKWDKSKNYRWVIGHTEKFDSAKWDILDAMKFLGEQQEDTVAKNLLAAMLNYCLIGANDKPVSRREQIADPRIAEFEYKRAAQLMKMGQYDEAAELMRTQDSEDSDHEYLGPLDFHYNEDWAEVMFDNDPKWTCAVTLAEGEAEQLRADIECDHCVDFYNWPKTMKKAGKALLKEAQQWARQHKYKLVE